MQIGRYTVERPLGQGAMGEVYLAWDSKLSREVAIKLMDASIERHQDLIARFEREADTVANLRHPNIVKVYDKDRYDIENRTRYFIVMEYVEGEDLATLISQKVFISFEQKLEIVIKICRALDHAHNRDVIHRDIKPSNVRVTTDGDVCILDFGLAKFRDAKPVNSQGIFGTPHYMSPEQTLSSRSVDKRTDQFSAALILYELVTYEKPFHIDDPTDALAYMAAIRSDPHVPISERLPRCSEEFARIIDRALQKKPEDRYESCGEFADALAEFVKTLPQKEDELAAVTEQLRSFIRQCSSKYAGDLGGTWTDPLEGAEPAVQSSDYIRFRVKNTQLDYGMNLFRCTSLDARKTALLERFDAQPASAHPQKFPEKLKQPFSRRAAIIAPLVIAAAAVLVYVRPGQPEPGKLELAITPWAMVESIIDVKTGKDVLAQKVVTPSNIELPPGTYLLHLSNPKLGKMETQVDISPGKSTRVHETFPGFTPESR